MKPALYVNFVFRTKSAYKSAICVVNVVYIETRSKCYQESRLYKSIPNGDGLLFCSEYQRYNNCLFILNTHKKLYNKKNLCKSMCEHSIL